MRRPPASSPGRAEESGPRRRSLTPRSSDFVDYAEAKTEDTTTSQRPMDEYEQWLSGRFADDTGREDADEVTTAAEMEPPVRRRESGVRNREPSYADAYRHQMPTALEVEMDENPPTMERAEPWEVPLSHDAATDGYEPRVYDTERAPAMEEEEASQHDYQAPRAYESGETRMGQPRGYASNSASPEAIEVYSQKIPPAPAMPRIATPFGGFNRQAYAAPVQRQPQAMYSPSMHLSMNGQSMHGQSMNGQAMNAPAMQPMQQPMYRQSAVATAPPSRPFPPLPTQVVTAGSSAKEVHRAPWFCLGLAVGVVSMVVAFFMPTSHAEPVASSPLPTMQIAPTQQQAAQAPTAMQPPTMVQPPMQQQMQQMQPMQAQPPAQAIAPAPLPPATQAVAPMQPAPSIASTQKQLPTVDVRSLPVAGAKAQAPAPRRPQYAARPQAPRRPAAQPPKPLPQDDDDALAERAPAPAPAPKAAPAQQQAQDTNALAADTLLQAL